jgi:hypothetical protein
MFYDLYEKKQYEKYENMLFWLILRCNIHKPFLQLLLCDKKSYSSSNIFEITSSDYISGNVLKSWCKFFSIAKENGFLEIGTIAKRLLFAVLFELNEIIKKELIKKPSINDFKILVNDLVNKIISSFRLNCDLFSIPKALSLIYKYTPRDKFCAYKSSRNDLSLPGYENCQILHFKSTISVDVLSKIDFFNFENLKQIFPNALNSMNDLIDKKEFLAGINIDFKGTKEDLENISNKHKLEAVLKLLNKIKESLERTRVNYVGSEFVKQEKISKIFENKILKLNNKY